MVIKNNNDKNNNYFGENEKDKESPEKGNLLEHKNLSYEKKEAIRQTQKLEEKLAKELENIKAKKNLNTLFEFDEKNSNESIPDQERVELDETFREIDTKFIEYPFLRSIFPDLVEVCEKTRLGKKLFVDVGALLVGAVESTATTVQLGGYFLADSARLIISPIREYRRTVDYLRKKEHSENSDMYVS